MAVCEECRQWRKFSVLNRIPTEHRRETLAIRRVMLGECSSARQINRSNCLLRQGGFTVCAEFAHTEKLCKRRLFDYSHTIL